MTLYCKVTIATAPEVQVLNEEQPADVEIPVYEPDILLSGVDDILSQQEILAQAVLLSEFALTYTSIPSTTFTTESVGGAASWAEFSFDVTSILSTLTYWNRIIDFRFVKSNLLEPDSAYIKNIVLTITADTETEVKFDYSTYSNNNNCSIDMHPINSSGNTVHTYQYLPLVTGTITSATITFEMADDWMCEECCGNDESGTSINVAMGMGTYSP